MQKLSLVEKARNVEIGCADLNLRQLQFYYAYVSVNSNTPSNLPFPKGNQENVTGSESERKFFKINYNFKFKINFFKLK